MTTMKPGYYGVPDDVVEMTVKPGASRASCSVDLRRRVVRIAFAGGYRDILLEERQVYGGYLDWLDRIVWRLIAFALGFVATLMLYPLCR